MAPVEGVDPERVAIYIRWSTEEQGEGTTLAVQREACEHYVRAQGWQPRPELLFIDDGYSGGNLHRPGLGALRQAVQAGQVNCCVVYKLDRLSRSVLDTVTLVLQEWDGLCHVRSAREPIDTTTPTGKVFFYMLASYAEWERSVIRERTLSGKARRAQEGKNPGFTYPYGYRPGRARGEWVVDRAEAAVVRRVFLEYGKGRGVAEIAACLNAEGIRSRHGGPFRPSRLHAMLTNPCYAGTLAYGRSTLLSPALRRRTGKSRLRFEQPRYACVAGAVPALVSAEEYARAQAVRASRGGVKGRRALSGECLLSGIARCRCGAPLRGHVGGRQRLRYYRCGRSRGGAAAPCRTAVIPAAVLEEAVVDQLRCSLAAQLRNWRVAELAGAAARRRAEAQAALAAAEAALRGLQKRRRRLDADYDSGALPAALYAERRAALAAVEQELAAARSAHAAALAALTDPPGGAGSDAIPGSDVTPGPDGWDQLDPAERKQLLRHAVARCCAFRPPAAGGGDAPVQVDLALFCPARPDSSL